MKHAYTQLPDGYTLLTKLDLQSNAKTALLVNIASLLVAAILFVLGMLLVPIQTFFDFRMRSDLLLVKLLVVLVGTLVYLVLHELVHGICMKCFSRAKVRYGFTGLYAYTGSDAYFDKTAYLITTLAPVVLWGIVLLVLSCVLDTAWFWCVYWIQMMNLSGAAGDVYITCRLLRTPADTLVQDSGVSMMLYSRCVR